MQITKQLPRSFVRVHTVMNCCLFFSLLLNESFTFHIAALQRPEPQLKPLNSHLYTVLKKTPLIHRILLSLHSLGFWKCLLWFSSAVTFFFFCAFCFLQRGTTLQIFIHHLFTHQWGAAGQIYVNPPYQLLRFSESRCTNCYFFFLFFRQTGHMSSISSVLTPVT